MRLATVRIGGAAEVVLVDRETATARRLGGAHAGLDMLALIEQWDAGCEPEPTGESMALADLELLPPLMPPRNILCVGKNYREHASEFTRSGFDSSAKSVADSIPEHPIVFTKAPQCAVGSGAPIVYPRGVSEALDYEAELGVIIGKGGRGIARENVFDHVFGYTIINDVTARDLQSRHRQWFIGKSLDSFCPTGPWLVTADEIDAGNLQVRCTVNGELRQNANTRDLIFDIPTLVATLSAGMTLLPGDVLATGTPAGVGIGFSPPRYLVPDDEVVIEITGLGRLVNRVA